MFEALQTILWNFYIVKAKSLTNISTNLLTTFAEQRKCDDIFKERPKSMHRI